MICWTLKHQTLGHWGINMSKLYSGHQDLAQPKNGAPSARTSRNRPLNLSLLWQFSSLNSHIKSCHLSKLLSYQQHRRASTKTIKQQCPPHAKMVPWPSPPPDPIIFCLAANLFREEAQACCTSTLCQKQGWIWVNRSGKSTTTTTTTTMRK